MANLLKCLKDVLVPRRVIHGNHFNQFFINMKVMVTGSNKDSKLFNPVMSTVSSIAIQKYSNLDALSFNCCFKSPDISLILSETIFLVNGMSLNKCAFSGHTVSAVFTRHCFLFINILQCNIYHSWRSFD